MAFLEIKNRARSTLASGVDDDDTEWTVATDEGAKFPDTGDFHVTCEDEIVKCTARSGDVLTVTRAQEETAAAAHIAGRTVELRITAAIVEELQDAVAAKPDTFLELDDTPSSYAAQAGKVAKVNAGATALEFALRTKVTLETYAQDIFSQSSLGSTPFTAKINGTPSATSVVYDTDTGENSLPTAADAGKLVLHNLTRNNSRLIESVDRATNTITTQSSSDDWADNDDITTQSQVNTQAGYVDLDLSGFVAATVTGILALVFMKDTAATGEVIRLHTYEAYSTAKSIPLWNKTTTLFDTLVAPIPVVSQKITFLVTASGADTGYIVLKYFGKFEDI